MKGQIVMSQKEADRVPTVEDYLSGKISRLEAAERLALCERQITRIAKAYRTQGVQGFVHRSRGQPSRRKIPESEVNRALKLIRKHYHDFRPTLAHEKLTELHEISFGLETLRKAMISAGIYRPKRRKQPRIHQSRKRRERLGEMIQIDGSPHKWFEDRGPECTLLVYIDDATSSLMQLTFAESESTQAYFKATKSYLQRHGKPLSFYCDKHSVFRVNTSRGQSASLEDSTGTTQFGRAMQNLDIELIFAHSAPAKGRVEKANYTLQDRLVKELRLKQISTIEVANQFLPTFMDSYNKKFSKPPCSDSNAHRPLLPSERLDTILTEEHTRILSKNLEFQFQNMRYQVLTERPTYAMRHAPVRISLDQKSFRIFYKDTELQYKTLSSFPSSIPLDRKLLDAHFASLTN